MTVRLLAWADAKAAPLLADALTVEGVELAGLAIPSPDSAQQLERALGVTPVHDLRQALAEGNHDLLWVATTQGLDEDMRHLLRDSGIRAISSSPPHGDVVRIAGEPDGGVTARVVPLVRRSAGFRAARDALETFGQIRSVAIDLRCRPGQGSLWARLFDAMDLVETLLGAPAEVHASLAAPGDRLPDTHATFHGHLTANLRFEAQRSACLALSDEAPGWHRGAVILGEGGCLRVDDATVRWTDPGGSSVEAGTDEAPSPPRTPGVLIGEEILRLGRDLDASEPPHDHAALLARCEASRLSCLTGQAESPGRVLDMLQGV